MPQPPHSFQELYMSEYHTIDGFTSPTGTRWVRVAHGNAAAWIPYGSFHGNGTKAFVQLAAQGVAVIGADNLKHFIKQISAVREFPAHPLVEQSGWADPYFARPDGVIITPANKPDAVAVFQVTRDKCHASGDLPGWKRGVARPLKDQPIALFAVMLAFAPALLKLTNRVGNVGFAISGPKGTGKSTVQQLACSVMGNPRRGDDRRWWTTFDALFSTMDQKIATHADMLLVVDGADLFFAGETTARRAGRFKSVLTRLTAGTCVNGPDSSPADARLMYLTSSEYPLSYLNGKNSDVATASSGLLITLQLAVDRPYGVFDSLPKEYSSGSAFADSLIAAAGANHGAAMRGFLEALIEARAENEAGLCEQIEDDIAYFRGRCGVNPNDGAAVRIADVFGLVFVAAKLARHWRVLPQRVPCFDTVMACYRLYKQGGTASVPFVERVQALVADAATLHLGKSCAQPTAEALAACTAFVKEANTGYELWIRAKDIETVFPDWKQLHKQSQVSAVLITDNSRHLGSKRSLVSGARRQRMYRFRVATPVTEGLGLLEDDQESPSG